MRSEVPTGLDESRVLPTGLILYLKFRLLIFIVPYGAGVSGVFSTGRLFHEAFLALSVWTLVSLGFRLSPKIWLWFSLFFLGWISGGHHLGLSFSEHLTQVQGDRVDGVDLMGRLAEVRKLGEETQEWVLHGVSMRRWESPEWMNVKGRVLCRVITQDNVTPGKASELMLSGVLAQIPGLKSEGVFDARRFWWGKKVFYELRYSRVISKGTSLEESMDSESWIEGIRRWCVNELRQGGMERFPEYGLIRAMVLGERQEVTADFKQLFVISGTYHLFAISGLHVGVVGGVFLFIGRVVIRNQGGTSLLALGMIWMYTWMSGWQTSAWRAGLMFTLWVLGSLTRRPHLGLSIWCAAAWGILLWDPIQLWQPGFQLSFSVVFFLIVVFPFFQEHFRRFLFGNEEDSLEGVDRGRWENSLRKAGYWMGNHLMVSGLAWFGGLPWIAYYFGLITPGALLANVVVVLVCAWVMVASVCSLLIGCVWDWGQECFNLSAHYGMRFMVRWIEWCLSFSWMFFSVRALEFWVFIPWLLACLGGGCWMIKKGVVWGMGFWLMGLGVLVYEVGMDWGKENERMSVLPMGGGETIIFQTRGQPGLGDLIDCGPVWEVQHRLIPFLQWNGFKELNHVFYTHGDYRHCEGWEVLEEVFPASKIILSPHRSRSPSYQRLRKYLEGPARSKMLEVQAEDRIGQWEILHPPRDALGTQADDWCLVLRRNCSGWRVLSVSDLSALGQIELLNHYSEMTLAADVVVCGIPNEREPLIPYLLEAIQPKIIILNGGLEPGTLKLTPELKERLSYSGASLYITEEDGQVDCWFSQAALRVKGFHSGREVVLKRSNGSASF